jgi:hypothetical protein
VRLDRQDPVPLGRFLQESRHSAGAEVVVAQPVLRRDSRHLVMHADVLFELGRRFGVHRSAGGGEVLLDPAVDDLDARPPAYRTGSRMVRRVACVDGECNVRASRASARASP